MTQTEQTILNVLTGHDPKNSIVGFTYYQDADKFLNKTFCDEFGNRDRSRTYEAEFNTKDIKRFQKGQGRLGLSIEYKKTVENLIRKNGGEVPEWETQGLNGFHWLKGYENLILVNDTDGRLAVRIYGWKSQEVHYEMDGKAIEEATIKGYIKPKKKQYVRVNGTEALDENGKPIDMQGYVPKIFYLDHFTSFSCCGDKV